ncbi:MAG TPA: mechanosensitive ion channel domain-containing protein [Steroidobacteraceae bacterium]|nr:mechanosensitive ion channel domain-containing protein [Steroidobacteraceae bacterium]
MINADSLASSLTQMLEAFIVRLDPGAATPVFGTVTWAELSTAACAIVLAMLAQFLAAFLVRRSSRPGMAHTALATAETRELRRHTVGALSRPAYVFIWACGVYLAVTALLPGLGSAAWVRMVQSFLGTVLNISIFAVLIWLIVRLSRVLEAWLSRWALRARGGAESLLLPLIGRGLRVMAPVLGIIFALPILTLPQRLNSVADTGVSILFIVAVATILFQAVRAGERAVLARYDITAADNLRARTVHTQVRVIGRVVDVFIGLFTLACVLMLFTEVRHIGASVLASAGIAGIIAGVAAQKTIGNLLAGFQIALTQPVRQDDVVVVEGAWGRIEEITLTYVVVRVWDDTRLVLPLSYFIEKPFQNWTRTTSGILGSVFVWVDYSFPVEEARAIVKRIIEASALWDGRFWNLQVTDTSERCMQLRVLATAQDSSKSWDLRCEIREKLIACIQERWPQTLPRVRAELRGRIDADSAALA